MPSTSGALCPLPGPWPGPNAQIAGLDPLAGPVGLLLRDPPVRDRLVEPLERLGGHRRLELGRVDADPLRDVGEERLGRICA